MRSFAGLIVFQDLINDRVKDPFIIIVVALKQRKSLLHNHTSALNKTGFLSPIDIVPQFSLLVINNIL